MGQYLLNFLIGIDRSVNTILGGNPSETLSSVAYRKHRDGARWGFMMQVINFIFANEDHCKNAYDFDRTPNLAP